MKQFLADILFTLAIVFTMATVVWHIPSNEAEQNNYAYKYHYMESPARDSIEVLLLGNSHFEYSLDPHVLGKNVFDLATAARYPHYDALLIERYVPAMPSLKAVIYPLGILERYADRFKKGCAGDHYLYMHLPSPPEWGHLGNITPSAQWFHRLGYKRFQHNRLCDTIGYQSLGDAVHNARYFVSSDTSGTALAASYLARMARVCRQHGVRFIAVAPPHNLRLLDGDVPAAIKAIDNVVATASLSAPIEYHNCFADTTFQADSLYHDAKHLNHTGATLFAQRIKADFEL